MWRGREILQWRTRLEEKIEKKHEENDWHQTFIVHIVPSNPSNGRGDDIEIWNADFDSMSTHLRREKKMTRLVTTYLQQLFWLRVCVRCEWGRRNVRIGPTHSYSGWQHKIARYFIYRCFSLALCIAKIENIEAIFGGGWCDNVHSLCKQTHRRTNLRNE